jgi:5-methylcytosine-specific restriction endonuclease McrA
MKKCTNCSETKPLDAFGKRKASKDGLDPRCRTCKADYLKDYYRKNSDHIKQKSKETRAKNPDRKYPETSRAASRKWKLENPERVRALNNRRRATKANASGTFTAEQWDARLAYYDGECVYCGTTDDITIEHRIPLSRGGTNWPSNLVPACTTCNCKKGTKTETEYKLQIQ